MDNCTEYIEFSYCFNDRDDGTEHTVRSCKRKDCITADELCEMFLSFVESAGYSTENVFNYFTEN